MTRFFRFFLAVLVALVLGTNALLAGASTFGDTAVHVVPTFHAVSIYWAPGGSVGNVQVKFRPVTNPASAFRDGQALWFDNRATTVSYGQEYRGSIVDLQPGTTYEIQLTPSGASAPAVPQVTTWNTRPDNVADDPAVVTIQGGTSNFTITAGGSAATGYKVYDGWNGTSNNVIDVGAGANNCININASFVVVRRLVCRGGLRSGIQIADNVTNVVIEELEVTDFEQAVGGTVAGWGNFSVNDEGAIKLGTTGGAAQGNNSKIVIQKSKLHTPRLGSFPWSFGHPSGSFGIFVEQARGQNVFRWNEIYSAGTDHQWFQDCISGTDNFSTQGSPGADSDIYGNALRNCYDDGIEAEGGGRNVRVWANYIDHTGIVMGNASVTIGPLYLWRNVSGQLANIKCPTCTETSEDRGPFIKGGSTDATFNGGATFYYHNTILQPPGVNFPKGAGFGVGDAGGNLFNYTSRNNIWHIHRITDNPGEPDFFSISDDCSTTQPCSANFDLYNGRVFNGGANAEASSVAMGWGVQPIPAGGATGGTTGLASAVPTYATSNGTYPAASAIPTLENGWVGDLRLAATSLGTSNVPLLPNFNDQDGTRHVGAQPPGAATMKFGIGAATGGGGGCTTPLVAHLNTTPSPATGTVPFTVSFDGSTSTPGCSPIASYSINFGDNTSGSGVTQSHSYSVAGTYTATLTVADANNQTASDSKTVTANPPTGTAYELDFDAQPGAVVVQGTTVNVTVAASDARPLQSMKFYVDGVLTATDTTSPYQFSWVAPATGNSHTITAEATDTNNVVQPKTRTITVLSQTCNIFTGAASVQQGAAVDIQGLCASGVAVSQMELYVDGVLRNADVGAPFTWRLDTSSLAVGSHTLTVRGVLASGESSQSANLAVTAAPLTVTFNPGPVVMRSDRMTVDAAASDGRALKQVDFYIDGVFMRGETAVPYELQWNTTAADRHGRHTLTVIATDTVGNQLSATRDVYLTTRTCNVLMGTTKYIVGSHDTVFAGPHSIAQGQLVTVQGVCAVPIQQMEFYLDGATTPAAVDSVGPTYTFTFPTSPATTYPVGSVHTIAIRGVISATAQSNHSMSFEIIDP